jgi:hypothetical protein
VDSVSLEVEVKVEVVLAVEVLQDLILTILLESNQ